MKALALLLACLGLLGVQAMPVSDVAGKESAKAIGGMANAIANIFDRVGTFFPEPSELQEEEEVAPPEEIKEVDLEDVKPAPEKKDKKEGTELDDMFAKGAMGMMKGMSDMMKGFGPMMSNMMKDLDDMPDMGDMMDDMPGFGEMMGGLPDMGDMMGEIDINLDTDDPDFSKESTESKKVGGDTIVTHKKESKHTGKDGSVSYINTVDKQQARGHSYSVVKVYENDNSLADLFGPDAVPSPTPMPELPAEDENEAEPENEAVSDETVPEMEGDTTAEEDELDPALFGPDAIPSPTPMPDLPMEEVRNIEETQDGGDDDVKPQEEEQANRALFFEPHGDDEARKAMFDLV
ncbi:uncharacterized protein LOC118406428 isoform X2 [Branchiostoma floridae]|uniref:Uncharacterized protein LOC118406428 isoform X1 n=1 Tax=Branchiostoma floridae TaxID=7739 RepID=A0A9J7HMX8_BRAFL|nr:uncharacterized protein LOC118406428 isoform X1 [Branchiostoma floridae]XP_035662373.1 uncharacterized protein LOC118406428 isoform X2 [Branchiostoma floridae]